MVNYVPIVRIEDWFRVDGGLLLIDKAIDDCTNTFKQHLDACGLSASLLEVHEPHAIVRENFPLPEPTDRSKRAEKQTRDAEKASKLATQLGTLKLITDPPLTATQLKTTLRSHTSLATKTLKDLMTFKIAGHYFIPSIGDETENRSEHGYVALLREIHHLPRESTKQLVDGLVRDSHATQSAKGLCFSCFDFVCPVCELESPWTEHFMQAFTTLFGRIGVADHDTSRASVLLHSLSEGTAQ